MCCKTQHSTNLPEKKFRLADFFNAHWDEYCKHPTKFIEAHQYKAVNAIRVCRTEALGIDNYVCPECGETSEVRHNCKNRFCPTCSWLDTVKWSERIKSQMLDIPHRHVVFTLPHKLNPLIQLNPKVIYNILGRASSDTLKEWIKDNYNLKTGIVLVLHTFGEKKNLHVHVHMIVAWGGIDFKTGELKTIDTDFIDYKYVQDKFRENFEKELFYAFKNNELVHNFEDQNEFKQFIEFINDVSWKIHIEKPMQTPEEVIRYIGRYSKRVCLSEYKITQIDGEYISFSYKDNKDREDKHNSKCKAPEKVLRLHYSEFFPLLLQHVPLPYFRLVKYYGCYALFGKIPAEYKSKPEEEKLSEILTEEYKTAENNPKYCANCACTKIYNHTLIDIRPKQQRTEVFDIQKHKHIIYIKPKMKNKTIKKAA